METTDMGQYLAALAKVRPGHAAKFPGLMAASHVYLTGKSATAWRYCNSAHTLGRSLALRAAEAAVHAEDMLR